MKAAVIIRILFPSVLLATYSCGHKEIECPGAQEINVSFNWKNAADADVDGMALFFYPLGENERVWRFDIAGKYGGPVKLPSGSYELIVCNNDLPGIRLGDTESPSSIYASARRLDTETEADVYVNTGMLYCGKINRLEVTPCGVRYVSDSGEIKDCSRRIIRCLPDSAATLYSVKFINVSGLENVRTAVVELDGVRSSVLLGSGQTSDIPAALSINMVINQSDGALAGSACAFAPYDLMTASYGLKLRIVRTDGKVFARDIEIKPENVNVITRHNVVLMVSDITIPDEGVSGDIGGIDAIVDGWEVVVIDLKPTF